MWMALPACRPALSLISTARCWSTPPSCGTVWWKEARDHIRFTERQLTALAQGPSFAAGDRVAHAIFGEGTILEIDPDAAVYLIRFDEIATPRRISFRVPIKPI